MKMMIHILFVLLIQAFILGHTDGFNCSVIAAYKYNWCLCVLADIYCYGTHFVDTVDIMGVVVELDIRNKIIIYCGM